MKNTGLFFNYNYSEEKISLLLESLKQYELSEIKKNAHDTSSQKKITKLAKYISEIHKQDMRENILPNYNARWVISLVESQKYLSNKKRIINSIESMEKIEYYKIDIVSQKKLLVLDIENYNWIDNYKKGHIGSYIWDIASILFHIADPVFSDHFLKSYIENDGNKPSIGALYANIFYVQMIQAIVSEDEDNIIKTVEMIEQNYMFVTDIISYDTLIELDMIGYS